MTDSRAMRRSRVGLYAFLQLAVFVYSLSMLAAKAASNVASEEKWLTAPFLAYYAAMLLCLGVYALCWQPLLKKLSLSVAFCCKAMSVVWGVVGGALLFGEALTPQKLVGAAVVVLGIALVVTGRGEEQSQ